MKIDWPLSGEQRNKLLEIRHFVTNQLPGMNWSNEGCEIALSSRYLDHVQTLLDIMYLLLGKQALFLADEQARLRGESEDTHA
jgi:hypothetical protein